MNSVYSNNNKTRNFFSPFVGPNLILLRCLAILLVSASAHSSGVFTTDITSLPDTFTAEFETVEDAVDQLDRQNLEAALPNYTDTSEVSAIVDYRGLNMFFGFALNESNLQFSVPDLGIDEVFVAATRDDAMDQFVDYLKGTGFNSVNDIQRELARVSPVDPVAGNPSSLMNNMVSGNYDQAMMFTPSEFQATPGGTDLLNSVLPTVQKINQSTIASGGSFGIDIGYSHFDLEGDKADMQTIVFDYAYQFDDPLMKLKFKMPLSITDTEGSESYDADIGLTFTMPLTRSWTITPGVSYGIGGSDDLGGAAAINGYSILSSFRFAWGCCLFNIGNMVGQYETGSVSLGDYEIDPDIGNTIYRNGLVVYKPQMLFNLPTMLQFVAIDTRYTGDDLYAEHYYEFGFSIGLITEEDLLAEDGFALGLTYIAADDADIEGYKANFGYRF